MSSTGPDLPPLLSKEAWHTQSVEAIADKLSGHLHDGLSHSVATQRLAELGPNELREAPRPPFLETRFAAVREFPGDNAYRGKRNFCIDGGLRGGGRYHGDRAPQCHYRRDSGIESRTGACCA